MPTCRLFSYQDVLAARDRLHPVARRTPLVRAQDLFPGGAVYFKAENLQLTHAFKFRGAYNRSSQLSREELGRGLIAASSGNHALGLSLAGSLLGASVTVVMPEAAPAVKEQGCRRYGAEVVRHGLAYDDARTHAMHLAETRGLTYVQSFDDPLVAAGQATVAWEIIEDLPDVEFIVVPVGGGGLLSGVLGLVKGMPEHAARIHFPSRRQPLAEITVVGVEAAGAPSMLESVRAGRLLELPSINTIADGIAVRRPGAWTYEVVSALVDELVTVSDEELLEAMAGLLLREKLLVEPAGAAAVAAVLGGTAGRVVDLGRALAGGARIACVLTGGNADPGLIGRLITPPRNATVP